MDTCRELATNHAAEGTVVWADVQTAGRGRPGHYWHSPAATALHLSILLRPPRFSIAPTLAWLTMLGALAVCDTVNVVAEQYLQLHRASIKWPNDVMLNGRKVAGLLVESAWQNDQIEFAIVGIGLNVNTQFVDLPPSLSGIATSLSSTFGATLNREEILILLLSAVERRYLSVCDCQINTLFTDYTANLATIGQHIVVSHFGTTVEGIAKGIAADGSLLLKSGNMEHKISFGEITVRESQAGAWHPKL